MKTRLQPLKNRKKQETCLKVQQESSQLRSWEDFKCKFKIRKWVQLEAHNHSKIDTKGEGNSKRATLICTLVFKPQNQAGWVSLWLFLAQYIPGGMMLILNWYQVDGYQTDRVCNTSVDTSAYTRGWPIYQTNTGLYLPDTRQKWVWNPIPGPGMKVLKRIQYQELYNTQYQNQRAWWVQKLDTRWLWPGVSNPNNGNGPNEAPESSANFFFFGTEQATAWRASTLAACAKFKCKTVDKPLVLTSDPKKERKSKRAFERFLTVSSNPKWRINSFHILGVCCRAWCQSFFFFLTKAMCTTREIWLLSI